MYQAGYDIFPVHLQAMFAKWEMLKWRQTTASCKGNNEKELDKCREKHKHFCVGHVADDVNQASLFSFHCHIYLGGSRYKCEIKPPPPQATGIKCTYSRSSLINEIFSVLFSLGSIAGQFLAQWVLRGTKGYTMKSWDVRVAHNDGIKLGALYILEIYSSP